MEPEIIAILSTIIVALLTVLGKVGLNQRNNHKPHNPQTSNPHPYNPDDLRDFRLGDMSASWYEEKHKEILTALEVLTKAVKGELA